MLLFNALTLILLPSFSHELWNYSCLVQQSRTCQKTDKSYSYDVHVYILSENGIYSQIIYTGNISFILHLLS